MLFAISCIAIVSNLGIVTFTTAIFPPGKERFAWFVSTCLKLLLVKVVLMISIPKISAQVSIIVKRQAYIIKKFIKSGHSTGEKDLNIFAEKIEYDVFIPESHLKAK